MLRIDRKPHTLYEPAKAEAYAAELQADDEDGWTYRVVHDPSGRGLSFIEVIDEDGHTVGRM